MVYNYFISYNYYKNGGFGSGNTLISRSQKIDNFEQIAKITKMLEEKSNFDDVIVMNFILLSKENEGDINE